ncbi:MAG: class I SAM-dependent methyltransferase [Desulfocapsaceae bacterium]
MDIKPQIGIRVDPATPETASYLIRLAKCLNLPLSDPSGQKHDYVLALNGSRLELIKEADPKTAPLSADFLSGAVYYRFTHDHRINQPLAKAAGIKSGYRPTVLDGTAGFGEDAFVLASLGCRVTMIERSKVIWALLADAISRCGENDRVKRIFDLRVTLKLADSIDYLNSSDSSYDTVFLDPMYPALPKSPLNKQKMRMLREVVGDDPDGSELLTAALENAKKRVAVKRPARAGHLDDREPSFVIKAKSSRYDIYLIPYL